MQSIHVLGSLTHNCCLSEEHDVCRKKQNFPWLCIVGTKFLSWGIHDNNATKQEIIRCSQSTPLPASIRGQRPWIWVKVFLTVKENLGILQYLFTSNLYQYLIYLLLIIKKHWKLKNHRPHSLSLFESQHIVNAFSAVHYRVIRHTVMLEEGFSREMPSILTCHLSWTISQQLGRDRVHGYVTETSFNVNTKKTPFPKQL